MVVGLNLSGNIRKPGRLETHNLLWSLLVSNDYFGNPHICADDLDNYLAGDEEKSLFEFSVGPWDREQSDRAHYVEFTF